MKAAPGYCLIVLLVAAFFYSCRKEYSYERGPVSAGTLDCSTLKVGGDYYIGKNLADSNFLEIRVQVTKAGSYHITSDTLNGFSFATAGKFDNTGVVNIKLQGKGKPSVPGSYLFTLSYDSSSCQVSVNVFDIVPDIVPTTNPDHFPLTPNNRWVYDDLVFITNPGDSIIRTIVGDSTTPNGVPHKILDEYKSFYPATNEHYYVKTGGDYFRYTSISGYTSAFNFSPSLYGDVNFLRENLSTGDAWYTQTWSGRTSRITQFVNFRLLFRCIDADATVTINGKTFLHVYKIQMLPEWAEVGSPLKPSGEILTTYYAKGIGPIYAESYNTVLWHPVMKIRSWAVH